MRRGRATAIGIAALGIALPGETRAAAPPADANTVSEVVVTASKTVSELVITAPVKCPRVTGALRLDTARRPAVISSFPAKGQMIRPGLVVMRVTFDRPVACAGGFSNDPPLTDPCPDQPQHMVLSYNRRTVRTVCLVDPDRVYGVRLRPDASGEVFQTVDGDVAQPFSLRFSTTLDAPVTDVCEALRQDVEMLAEVQKAHALDCGPSDDPQAAVVRTTVEQRDAAARAARDQAIAEARALREQQAAADLARAETLALAAYRKARDRSWAATRRSEARNRPKDERLVVAPVISLNAPAPGILSVLPTDAAAAANAQRLTEPTQPPELPDWRQAFVVGEASYDCGFKSGAVTCARR